jgi:hypothetical protein
MQWNWRNIALWAAVVIVVLLAVAKRGCFPAPARAQKDFDPLGRAMSQAQVEKIGFQFPPPPLLSSKYLKTLQNPAIVQE